MNVTIDQLAAVIEAMPGAQPATARTRTVLDLLKTGNPFGEVVKYSRVNLFIGANYQNSVQRQQVREGNAGDFEAQLPKWGTRIGKKLLIHKGKLYCPTKIGKSLEAPRYEEVSTGVGLIEEQVKPFFQKKSSNAEAQGVEKEVIWRTYKLESFQSLTIGGETYDVVSEILAEATTVPAPSEEAIAPEPVR